MPPSLLKLFVAGSSTIAGTVTTDTTTDVVDAASRFQAIVSAAMIDSGAGTTTIPDTSFLNDAGDPVIAGGLPLNVPGGYFNVFVNGVLQQGGLSTLGISAHVLATADIYEGTPVVLEFHNYTGTTSTSTSTPNLTVSTTILT